MAETYWDPGNLLQVTEFEDTRDIQCIGIAKTRNDARCGWRQPASISSVIRAKLAQMAAKLPSQVTDDDLESLAKLCLCSDWHRGQWARVAGNWKRVVARAVRHYERSSTQMEQLILERQRCFELLGQQASIDADLSQRLSTRFMDDADLRDRMDVAFGDIESGLLAARQDLLASQAQMRTMEGELERAKLRQTELTEGHRAAIFQLEESRKSERARLEAVLREGLQKAGHCLEEEQARTNALREVNADLERRLSEATSMAESSAARVDDLCRDNEALCNEKKALETSVADLQTHLATATRQLQEETDKTTALQGANEDLERRLLDAKAEAESSARQADRLSTDNEMLCNEKKALETSVDDLLTDLATATRQLQEETDKTTALQGANEDLERRLLDAKAEAESSARQADRLSADNETLRNENSSVLNQLDVLRSDLGTAQHEIRRLRNDRSAIEKTLRQSQTDMETIRTENAQLTGEKYALQAQVATLEQDLSRRWRYRLRAMISKLRSVS
ncbi:hypothetical protein MFIFM68171_04945 [Madurella fahalii]|uniref:Uncharacterized protein n=1 Tax=Madurella fahalii TaxID=1157608 RepID=A0ABQ0GAD9_9PEZI